MKSPKWEDVSSWSRDEKDRTPKTWQCRLGPMVLVVTRHVHYRGWVMRSDFDECQPLMSSEIEAAKNEALERIMSCLLLVVDDCRAMLGCTGNEEGGK